MSQKSEEWCVRGVVDVLVGASVAESHRGEGGHIVDLDVGLGDRVVLVVFHQLLRHRVQHSPRHAGHQQQPQQPAEMVTSCS